MELKKMLVSCLACFTSLISVTISCMSGWSLTSSGEDCYLLGSNERTWQASADYCRSLNEASYLASIPDADSMNSFKSIQETIPGARNIQRAWIGLSFDEKSNKWKWADGEDFDESKYPGGPWAASQPDNPGVENCVAAWMLVGAQFMDFNCDFAERFFCKMHEWGAWGEWSQCSITCGKGSRSRNRTCPAEKRCPGDILDSGLCENAQCAYYGDWGSWSDCSATCEGGNQTRKRSCINGPGCVGDPMDWQSCNDFVSCFPPTTPVPLPTLGAVEKVVVQVVQTLGCTALITILSATLAALIFLRNYQLERLLMMNVEASLLTAHILIMTGRDNYGNWPACETIAAALHYFFLVHFTFLLFQALHSYCVTTSVIVKGIIGKRWHYMALGWGGPLIIVAITSGIHHHNYVTRIMCVLNLRDDTSVSVLVPMVIIIISAFAVVEANGMDIRRMRTIPGYDEKQMFECRVTYNGLLVVLPLSIASWISMLIAISEQNLGMFTLCFTLNLSLALAIMIFHALANAQVKYIFMRIQHRLRRWRNPRKRFADGTFEAEYFPRPAAVNYQRNSSVAPAEIFRQAMGGRKKKVFLLFKF